VQNQARAVSGLGNWRKNQALQMAIVEFESAQTKAEREELEAIQ